MTSGVAAGNNSTNLQGIDRDQAVAAALPSAADLDAHAEEQTIKDATGKTSEELDREIEFEEATIAALEAEPVTIAEFNALRDDFNSLVARVDAFNTRSGHQI